MHGPTLYFIVVFAAWKWYGYFPTVFEFSPIWKGFYPSISDSEYPISVIDPYLNAQKLYFYDVDIHYNLIQQKLILYVSDFVFEHKYENILNTILAPKGARGAWPRRWKFPTLGSAGRMVGIVRISDILQKTPQALSK